MSVTARQPLAERARSKPLFFWIVLLLGTAMLGEYLLAVALTWRYGTDAIEYGWNLSKRNGQWIVASVNQGGSRATCGSPKGRNCCNGCSASGALRRRRKMEIDNRPFTWRAKQPEVMQLDGVTLAL